MISLSGCSSTDRLDTWAGKGRAAGSGSEGGARRRSEGRDHSQRLQQCPPAAVSVRVHCNTAVDATAKQRKTAAWPAAQLPSARQPSAAACLTRLGLCNASCKEDVALQPGSMAWDRRCQAATQYAQQLVPSTATCCAGALCMRKLPARPLQACLVGKHAAPAAQPPQPEVLQVFERAADSPRKKIRFATSLEEPRQEPRKHSTLCKRRRRAAATSRQGSQPAPWCAAPYLRALVSLSRLPNPAMVISPLEHASPSKSSDSSNGRGMAGSTASQLPAAAGTAASTGVLAPMLRAVGWGSSWSEQGHPQLRVHDKGVVESAQAAHLSPGMARTLSTGRWRCRRQ